jgi:uncharacterized FlaG/YvyC family protein
MGFRIGKVTTDYVTTAGAVKRKLEDQSARDQQGQQQQGQQKPKRQATLEEVQRAVGTETVKLASLQQDIRIEAYVKEGLVRVRVGNPDGTLIRDMSGDEFIELQGRTQDDRHVVGRVLDQKY